MSPTLITHDFFNIIFSVSAENMPAAAGQVV
jgi:hypothetical protein